MGRRASSCKPGRTRTVPKLNYSLECWQGLPPPVAEADPADAAQYFGDCDWYDCRSGSPNARASTFEQSTTYLKNCRDGGIRTRGLLLPNQLQAVARCGLMPPDMPFTWGNARFMSPDIA
jgi:hypothetical protein